MRTERRTSTVAIGVLLLAATAAQAKVGSGLHGILRVGSALPEFPAQDGSWLWAPMTPTVKDLDGRFGILYVWRQGLMECRHSLEWLSDLAVRRPEMRIYSMHAPRYDWERDLGRLADLQDYEALALPVLWDDHRAYFRAAGIRNYPTVILFDPAGKVVWFHEGLMKKGQRPGEMLEKVYDQALEDYLRGLVNGPEPDAKGGVLPPLKD